MTHQIIHTANVSEKIKKMFPDTKIVIGGAHATIAPLETLSEFSVFDIAVIGEGERTLIEIVKTISDYGLEPKMLSSIKGIAWRYENEIKINEPREQITDLDSLPFPNYDHIQRKIKIYPIFSSRGCPFNCIFCCRIHGNQLRVRSPTNVVKEIEYAIQKYKPILIDFADDQATFPRNRMLEICDLIINKNLNEKVKWTVLSRVTNVDYDLFKRMKEAGCINIDFGVESGNREILKIIKKGITIEDAKSAIYMAKKARIKTGSYFIIGHPFETIETAKQTITLAKELNTDTVSFGLMVPYPGTEVNEMMKKGFGNYKPISSSWDDFDKQIGNALELRNLSRKQLERLQIDAYLTFYVRNFRFLSLIRLVISQRKLVIKYLKKFFS
jgi:radical SAM superfamily enzyme YgiQ (UPF0313 family)